MRYYAIVGQGPWQEVLVTREPRGDGLLPSDPGYRGMKTVGQQPTGVTYRTWRAATQAIGQKNRALFAAR